MNVLMLNTFDDVAGADRSARRLQQGLRRLGVDASLLVQFRYGDGSDILCSASPARLLLRRLKLYLGMLPVRLYPHRPENNFTPALLPDRLPAQVARLAPDIVHLHWLGAGFCGIKSIGRFDRPLVWTLHDSWPFTGGCHVPGDCRKYRERCGACPVLGSRREADLSRWTWRRKRQAWRQLRPILVAPSRWLADCARASSLFRDCQVEVIPNGLDTEAFRPMDQQVAREQFGLPRDRPVVLFGAVNALTDPNKGWQLLQPALKLVSEQLPDALLAVFGAAAPAVQPDVGMPMVFLGRLRDEASLVAAYSAADVFVAPSLQESFCQTVLEAMACGTPAVAFGATGPLDVVVHQECGYLAQPYESADLARGILWVLGDRERHARLVRQARQRAEDEFGLDRVAAQYLLIYREMLATR
jgi:glycosyltransferase involved in cell wall biosynthesis